VTVPICPECLLAGLMNYDRIIALDPPPRRGRRVNDGGREDFSQVGEPWAPCRECGRRTLHRYITSPTDRSAAASAAGRAGRWTGGPAAGGAGGSGRGARR